MTENQNKRTAELLQLIRENPELPVVPMVNSEVIADDSHAWWLGEFGMCSIDSYYSDDDAERVWLKADDEEDMLDKWADDHYDEIKDMSNADAEAYVNKHGGEWINSLPWIRAIVVWIDV